MNSFLKLAAVTGLALTATAASATINTVYNSFTTGLANFNTTVSNAGATATHTQLTNFATATSVDFGDFTITRNNGGAVQNVGVYNSANFAGIPGAITSGNVISIQPSGPSRGLGAKPSGLTFTFDNAINAIGFEVADWATCCTPSDLYISFDNGAPILVGHSVTTGDAFLTNNAPGVFVAALNDAGTFSSVSFWGDGFGEALYMGGTIHYAKVEQQTLQPQDVPEPAMLGLFGLGAIGLGLTRRRGA